MIWQHHTMKRDATTQNRAAARCRAALSRRDESRGAARRDAARLIIDAFVGLESSQPIADCYLDVELNTKRACNTLRTFTSSAEIRIRNNHFSSPAQDRRLRRAHLQAPRQAALRPRGAPRPPPRQFNGGSGVGRFGAGPRGLSTYITYMTYVYNYIADVTYITYIHYLGASAPGLLRFLGPGPPGFPPPGVLERLQPAALVGRSLNSRQARVGQANPCRARIAHLYRAPHYSTS